MFANWVPVNAWDNISRVLGWSTEHQKCSFDNIDEKFFSRRAKTCEDLIFPKVNAEIVPLDT